jgi:hypothetical protein
MPFDCQHRARYGPEVCHTSCPAHGALGALDFARVERAADLPPADARVVDVALLDMHHGWPNLGHDSIVHALQAAVCDMHEGLRQAGVSVRVISYDVRRGHMIPEPPGGRHVIYIGTGGPGHLDPAKNDGVAEGSQGIAEDPAWEARLFRVFDRVLRDEHASLFGVCHTFGVMCRWLGVADVVLRGREKGGKSAGITDNVLTDEAVDHPWYGQFAAQLPDGRHFRILDNRLYDLIPRGRLPAGMTAIAHETLRPNGPAGDAITMIEAARDPDGVMPRVVGVNHHPEIVNRQRQITVLRHKLERGSVSREWYEERMRTLTEPIEDEFGDRLLHLTASYTLMAPLRFSLYRAVQERADSLRIPLGFDAADLPLTYTLAADTLSDSAT